MKKKIILLVFLIFVFFLLIGCSGVVTPPLHNAEEILRVVDNFLLSLSGQGLVFTAYFNYIETNGNNSEVNINLILTATVCIDNVCSSSSKTINNISIYLIKINDIWKLKKISR